MSDISEVVGKWCHMPQRNRGEFGVLVEDLVQRLRLSPSEERKIRHECYANLTYWSGVYRCPHCGLETPWKWDRIRCLWCNAPNVARIRRDGHFGQEPLPAHLMPLPPSGPTRIKSEIYPDWVKEIEKYGQVEHLGFSNHIYDFFEVTLERPLENIPSNISYDPVVCVWGKRIGSIHYPPKETP